mgnify:CR=1 FL=1
MISLTHVQRIFFARTPADMRKQAYGLAALVESHLEKDPLSGDVFVFVNRHATILKILMWDVSGYWVAGKRLEQGRYAVRGKLAQMDAKGCHAVSVAEIMNIIEGIDVRQARYHNHYESLPDRVREPGCDT